MITPTYSVIIPTFQRQALLHEAVDSVLSQAVEDVECIVVDDASPVPISSFDDPRVSVVRHSANRGAAAARNTGMARANGRVILFLDDDDLFLKGRLQLAEEGQRRAPVSICWSSYLGEESRHSRWRLEGDVSDRILDATTPHLDSVAIGREALLPFDERYLASEDVEWWLRMASRHHVSTVPEVGVLIRRHDGPRNLNGPEMRIRTSLMLLRDYKDYFRAHPRAAAFRWKRIGLTAAKLGDYRLARSAFLRSFGLRRAPKTIWHLSRSVRSSTREVSLEGSAPA